MLFPGHASEAQGMGLELAAVDPRAAALLQLAGEQGGFSAAKVLRRGGEALADTRVLQPLMTAVALGVSQALARVGVRPRWALGHSLGELAAFSALGGVDPARAIALAARRGQLMGALAVGQDGAMLALPKLSAAALESALALGRAHGVVDVALHNAPQHWVLSGDRAALLEIGDRVGGSLVATSGAWHCAHMRGACAGYRAALQAHGEFGSTPGLILNHDGAALGERGRGELIDALVGQLDGAVQFAAGMATLAGLGVRELILAGPAKLLRLLVRENFGVRDTHELPLRLHVAERPADIEAIGRLIGTARAEAS
ncbi:ACP S-malonyltransferase [Enhygromyxa salina]|uniref:[acyl-carrier-protein] S-malonyltransferase n=1 Tax=Enhygromyxa salina TaxID=215803 RepID=A0A2S9YVU1_9BACT|nr:acyltransferase domain-containing protein [Enhygromyxa salina]PRQ09231.1 Polyketide biosynthesis malonyl CoA-acyl carrier protein transacylase BaeC [Enhygromyxa salina]